MRSLNVLLCVGAIVLLNSPTFAIEFHVIGSDFATVSQGGAFTIDIAIENASAETTIGLTGTLTGLSSAGAVVTSGQSAGSHFVTFCSATDCFAGIDTIDNVFFSPDDLSQNGAYTPGDDLIAIVNALSLSATSETGAIDPGLDGPIDVPSDRDVTIHLIANIVGTHVLTIGGEFSDGVNILPVTDSAIFTVTVVPEPGTAILIGLGLVGLAGVRSPREIGRRLSAASLQSAPSAGRLQ